jgi:hypothetical protein
MKSFYEWLAEAEAMGLQAPTTRQYVTTAAKGIGKAAAGVIPLVGTAIDLATAANELWKLRQSGQDVTPLILKMMDQQDQNNMPANAFDLEDDLADTLSNEAKQEIAKRIVAKIDKLIALARTGKIPPNAANIEAINYVLSIVKPMHRQIRQA